MRGRPKWAEVLADRFERALRFPSIGLAVALGIAVISARVLFEILANAYYVYYNPLLFRPKATHHYPPLRYAFEQFAIFAWCLLGLVTSLLLFRSVTLKRDISGWLLRSLLLFVTVLVVLGLGIVIGDWRLNR
jgi:hypothetical protein